MFDDTICAPSTPPVNSSIAIIRISGPDTVRAVNSIFSHPVDSKPRYAHYGTIASEGAPVDDVIVTYFQAPRSYSGEDMAEISCHGNPIIIQKIITLLVRRGLRMAEPGEFTRRAFINGKVDLTGAEAINHIITARSEWEIETSLRQMHGSLREVITGIRTRIIELKADLEAGIDFSDEEIELISTADALASAAGIGESINDLAGRCKNGERLSRGIDITITGKPNVGKSSVLNLLLNQERALVSHIPGTTRDIIREPFQIAGMQVNLVDTAGIDTPGDEIERLGIDLSHRNIDASPFILLVLDAHSGMNGADLNVLDKTRNKKRIIIINKTDIAGPGDITGIRRKLNEESILFSARTGAGMVELKEALALKIKNEFVHIENSFVADMRVITLLDNAAAIIARITGLIGEREPAEIIAFELQGLMDTLAEITGEITPDNILESIFSRFCIGK